MTAIKPENVWFNQIELVEGETIALSYPSNHTQGKRAIGGKLFVTNQRIAFAPNRLDGILGGHTMEVPLSGITLVTTDPPRIRLVEIFSGALVTRLAIHAIPDQVDFFVVSNPDIVANQITAALKKIAEQDVTPNA